MAPIEILLSFAVATAIFAYMPGPALLPTAAQTMARARRSGLVQRIFRYAGGPLMVGLGARLALVRD